MPSLRLASFADAFPVEMKEKVEGLAVDLVRSAEQRIETDLREPERTGALRGSRSLVDAGGGALRLGWSNKSAIGIDVGRIQSQPYRRSTKSGGKSVSFSRLLGSGQTPEGFTRPAIQALRSGWEQVAADAGKDF